MVSIEYTNEGLLVLNTAEPPTVDMQQESDSMYKRIQNILQFDMQDWRDLIKKYEIKGSMIPHRKKVEGADAGSWY